MINPAFIVDGYTELKIIQHLCPNRPIKRTDLNGKFVKIPLIVKRIASHIRLLGNKYYPIIVLVDKEEREISCVTMIEQIKQGLIEHGLGNQDIRVGVADRMIENWIISDWNSLDGKPKDKPKKCEGMNGSAVIKKLKGNYNKTTDGVDYFISACPKTMFANSDSFRHFINELKGIECEYLEFRNI